MSLVVQVLEGNRLALARLLTQIENNTPEGLASLNDLYPYTGRAHLVGVTGAPGTGKSSLVNQLARLYRNPPNGEPKRVAVVAVDPSSPFTGGAILGDRVRMRDLAGDPGVFIRSMASRGSLGGLASTTAGLVQALDAAGFNLIMIETVGAGQAEVDIARLAHTTLVIEAPGLGDDIQAIKAGILEIADILVINKADRPGADATERALRSMLDLAHPAPRIFHHHGEIEVILPSTNTKNHVDSWQVPIARTIAIDGQGIDKLHNLITDHQEYLIETGEWKRREWARLQAELDALLQETLVKRWRLKVEEKIYLDILQQVVNRQVSPWRAVEQLIEGGCI